MSQVIFLPSCLVILFVEFPIYDSVLVVVVLLDEQLGFVNVFPIAVECDFAYLARCALLVVAVYDNAHAVTAESYYARAFLEKSLYISALYVLFFNCVYLDKASLSRSPDFSQAVKEICPFHDFFCNSL